MADLPKTPSGVQELIGRLRDEGVKAGKQEAERVLHEAQQQADEIIAKARAEADQIRSQARVEIEGEHAAAKEAIQTAFRDTRLKLESGIKAAFSAHVKRLVSAELRDRDFLRQLILALFGRATSKVGKGQRVELLLSEELFVTDEKGTRLTEEGREQWRHMVLGIAGEMLREGVDLMPAGDTSGGMRVRLVGEDLEIDLSDKALSELLLSYLIPRFRAIVTGVD